MTVLLFPRLDRIAVDQLVEALGHRKRDEKLHEFIQAIPDSVRYGPVGGLQVTKETLQKIRSELLGIYERTSKEKLDKQALRSRFDEECSIYLSSLDELRSGEALRDDVWAYIASCLVPELTFWRFGLTSERFQGGVRNAFQRLWMRGRAFDRGDTSPERWQLLRDLTEDAMVAITERPSIGNDTRLALAIGEAWSRASTKFGRSRMENIMRKAIIGIRLRNELYALSTFEKSRLADRLDAEFERASK